MSLSNAMRSHQNNWDKMQAKTYTDVEAGADKAALNAAVTQRGQDMTVGLEQAKLRNARPDLFSKTPLLDQKTGINQPLPATAAGTTQPAAVSTPVASANMGILGDTPTDQPSGTGGLDSILGWKKGGPVKGKAGLDQVPAQGPSGEPIRLSDGEYILPAAVVEAFGGIEALDAMVAQVTGEQPGGEPMAPLPEQMQGLDAIAGFAGGGTITPKRPLMFQGEPAVQRGSEQANMLKANSVGGDTGFSVAGPSQFRREKERALGIGETTPVTRTNAKAQAHPEAQRIAQAMTQQQPQGLTEQALLNKIGGTGNALQRMPSVGSGNVFKNQDLSRAGAPAGNDQRWSTNPDGSRRFNASAKNILGQPVGQGGHRMQGKDSGITYSDSIGGATEWSASKANLAGPEAAQLRTLYQRDADQRAATDQRLGLDGMTTKLSAPAISASERGQQISAQHQYAAAAPQREAQAQYQREAGLEAIKASGKANAGNAPDKALFEAAKITYGNGDAVPVEKRAAHINFARQLGQQAGMAPNEAFFALMPMMGDWKTQDDFMAIYPKSREKAMQAYLAQNEALMQRLLSPESARAGVQ